MSEPTDDLQHTVWIMRPVDDNDVLWVFSNEESARTAKKLAESMYRSVTLVESPIVTITGADL